MRRTVAALVVLAASLCLVRADVHQALPPGSVLLVRRAELHAPVDGAAVLRSPLGGGRAGRRTPLGRSTAGGAGGAGASSGAAAGADFNGDGFGDLAVGVPGEDVGRSHDAGAVEVLYGSAGGLVGAGADLFWQGDGGVPGMAEPNDLLGSAVAAGDFDHDGFADLAVGVPFEGLGRTEAAGLVDVVYGSRSGLAATRVQQWSQASTGVPGRAEADDLFGSALCVGDFDGDGVADLAVGVPGESVGVDETAGAVNVVYGARGTGLSAIRSQQWTQDSEGSAARPGAATSSARP